MKDKGRYKSLDNIEKGMLESYLHDPAHAVEDLETAGYDVNSMVAEGMDIINQYKFKQKVAKNKLTLNSLLSKAKVLLAEKAKVDRTKAISILSTLQVNVQYRNVSKFTDEELNEILKDVDLVKLIEELEKKG